MLAHEGTEQMRLLWLRSRQYRTSHLQQAGGQPCQGQVAADPQAQQNAGRQPRDGQPSQRRAAAHPQAQQKASRQPKPAPARAQAVPKPRTAAQIARHERSQKQLRQKHLARKMWASVRIASRLLAWRCRARYNGIPASQLGLFRARIPELLEERGCPLLTSVVALVRGCPPWTLEEGGRCLKSEVLLARHTRAALPTTPTSSAATAQLPPALALVARPPATQLAPPPPPSQPPPSALAAAARAALDACEMQDSRGSKRDALARTPPRPNAAPTLPPSAEPAPKKSARGRGLGSEFAAAAPAAAAPQPLTATSYHPAALAAANPYHLLA